MLKQFKAIYQCDACGELGEWLMGPRSGSWLDREGILEWLTNCTLPGWVKQDDNLHWCPKCFMVKPIKSRE